MTLKEELYQYIDKGDERLLKLMYAVAREYTNEESLFDFTDEEIKEFDERRRKRLAGESKTYSWEAVKRMITGK